MGLDVEPDFDSSSQWSKFVARIQDRTWTSNLDPYLDLYPSGISYVVTMVKLRGVYHDYIINRIVFGFMLTSHWSEGSELFMYAVISMYGINSCIPIIYSVWASTVYHPGVINQSTNRIRRC